MTSTPSKATAGLNLNSGYKRRPDYFDLGHGCAIQFSADAEPSIQWNHIDGPLLHSRFGQIEWLTMGERLLCAMSLADARSLERKRWPDLAERWDARAAISRAAGEAPLASRDDVRGE